MDRTDDADGSGTPAIIHLVHGPRGLRPTMVGLAGDRGDNIEWIYDLTVPAGQTVRLVHYTIVSDTRGEAENAAGTLITAVGFGGQAAAFLTEEELASIANIVSPPPDLRIQVVAFDGDRQLNITYEVRGARTSPFEIGFYRSADTAFGGDVPLDILAIDSSSDLTAGIHNKIFTIGGGADEIVMPGAGAVEVDSDYFLLAVADPSNQMDETAWPNGETNNATVMTGVYHAVGGPVMVHGISTRDLIKVLPKAGMKPVQVDFNGTSYEYAANEVTGVRVRGHNGGDEFQLRIDAGFGGLLTLGFLFVGGSGTNTAKIWGSSSTTTKDVATIYPMSGSLVGPGYTLSLAGMRGMTFTSQGGPDEACIYDSSLDDTFTAYPTYVTLSNSLYTNRAEGFRNVFAYAQVGGAYMPAGGNDVAHFYGIDGARDYFRASAMYGIMSDAETTRGNTYFVRGNWFEEVHAYGREVNGRPSSVDRDQAMLYDATTIDLFEAETATALATYAYSGASRASAHTFRVVKAYGATGDTANLYGLGTYNATSNPVMYVSDYTVWANGFDPIDWYSASRTAEQSTHAAAIDAALPLLFGEGPSARSVRKKAAPSAIDLALIQAAEA